MAARALEPALVSNESRPGFKLFLRDTQLWAVMACIVAAIAVCISKDSLWIDEGFTAWLIQHGTFGSLIHAMGQTPADDRQYPLYVLYIWSWRQIFGDTAYLLRFANIVFVVIYILAIAATSRLILKERFSWIPFAFVPFMWFYVSEARQYAMLMSFATVATSGALVYAYGPLKYRRRAVWVLGAGLFLSVAGNMLGFILMPGLLVILLTSFRVARPFTISDWLVPSAVFAPLILALGTFYASTITGAAFKTELRQHDNAYPTLAYAAAVVYEDAGLGGLGPPRNELRTNPEILGTTYAPWVVCGALILAVVFFGSFKYRPDARFWILFSAWAVSFTFALTLSKMTDSHFLARHVSAALPLLIFSLMFLTRSRVALILLAAVFLISDFRMTVMPAYGKDDYGSAVSDILKRNAVQPGSIDWVADWYTASYYGLALQFYPSDHTAQQYSANDYVRLASGISAANSPTPGMVEALLKSQLGAHRVVYLGFSKPDLFDRNHGWQRAIDRHHAVRVAQYRAFSIYEFRS